MFTVVLDACVLWSSTERDVLLQFAADGLFRPLWSSRLLDEVHACEYRRLVRRDRLDEEALASADRLVDTMQAAFPDAYVDGWEPLQGTYGLPDLDDEHVVALAAYGQASAIVTWNLQDFPAERVPHQIEVLDADAFALRTIELAPSRALRSLAVCAERSGRKGPSRSVEQIVTHLGHSCGWRQVHEYLALTDYGRR